MDHRDNEGENTFLSGSSNCLSVPGLTALLLVCALDMEGRCIEYLLGHKATPSLTDSHGFNALHYAAAAGNSVAVQHLLEFGESGLFSQAGHQALSPLHLAAYNGHRDTLLILLSRFNTVDLTDSLGRTPLYLSSYAGKPDCVSLLLEQGAMVTRPASGCGLTPVHCAASQGHVECLRLLLDNTEDSGAPDTPATTVLAASPLMMAAYPGHKQCVELLIRYGASVRSVDTSGRSALVWSVVSGQEDCVRVMIEAGADPRSRDSRGRTAAHVAAAHGQVIVLGTLLGTDSSSLSTTDKDGYTPVHYAAYHGQTAALEMVLQSEMILTTD